MHKPGTPVYATCTYPIMHVICPPPPPPPVFTKALFSVSLGTAVKLKTNDKQRLCKILEAGGGGGGGGNLGALWKMYNWRIVDAPFATTIVS